MLFDVEIVLSLFYCGIRIAGLPPNAQIVKNSSITSTVVSFNIFFWDYCESIIFS